MGAAPGRSARFEAFLAPASATASPWRLAAGAGMAAVCWLAATVAVLAAVGWLDVPEAGRVALLGFLAAFGGLIAGLALALRLLHRRGLGSVVGPGGWRLGDVARAAGVVALVTGLSVPAVAALAPPVRQADAAAWARWLPLALPAILMQAAAEELMFRGYLMQGLAARFRSRAVWLGVPAVLFGLLHWNPAEFGPNAWLVVLTAGVAGLLLGDVTARTGNLSAALGLHFANNAFALLVVGLPSPLASLTLYVYPVDPGDADAVRPFLMVDLVVILLAWAAWRALRRGGR